MGLRKGSAALALHAAAKLDGGQGHIAYRDPCPTSRTSDADFNGLQQEELFMCHCNEVTQTLLSQMRLIKGSLSCLSWNDTSFHQTADMAVSRLSRAIEAFRAELCSDACVVAAVPSSAVEREPSVKAPQPASRLIQRPHDDTRHDFDNEVSLESSMSSRSRRNQAGFANPLSPRRDRTREETEISHYSVAEINAAVLVNPGEEFVPPKPQILHRMTGMPEELSSPESRAPTLRLLGDGRLKERLAEVAVETVAQERTDMAGEPPKPHPTRGSVTDGVKDEIVGGNTDEDSSEAASADLQIDATLRQGTGLGSLGGANSLSFSVVSLDPSTVDTVAASTMSSLREGSSSVALPEFPRHVYGIAHEKHFARLASREDEVWQEIVTDSRADDEGTATTFMRSTPSSLRPGEKLTSRGVVSEVLGESCGRLQH